MSVWFFILLQVSILAYGLLGGVFLAFSDFIMRSLARTPGVGGIEAMQVINREVFRWVFIALFLGMMPVSLGIAIYGGVTVPGVPGSLMLLAGLVYAVGCFGVTACFNVPKNKALDGMDVRHDATRRFWTNTYLPQWIFWNTLRAIACIVSAGLLLTASGFGLRPIG